MNDQYRGFTLSASPVPTPPIDGRTFYTFSRVVQIHNEYGVDEHFASSDLLFESESAAINAGIADAKHHIDMLLD